MSGTADAHPQPWSSREFAEAVDGLAPVVLRVAATLRLADLVGDAGASTEELAAGCGAPAARLARVLDFLVCRGVFAIVPPGRVVQTALSSMLRSDHPSGLRSWLDGSGPGHRMDRAIAHLGDALRSDRSGYEAAFGRSFYDDLAEPSSGPSFDELRQTHGAALARCIVDELDWSTVRSVVDVGGGTGSLLRELLVADPARRGVLIDLPAAVRRAHPRFSAAGLADRVRLVEGDLFDPLPGGHDAYVLVNVLHNWPDEDVVRLLGGCARAAAGAGTVIVVERLTEIEHPYDATAMDLRALTLLGGAERSSARYGELAAAAGLALARVAVLGNGSGALLLRPTRVHPGSREVTAPGSAHPSPGTGG